MTSWKTTLSGAVTSAAGFVVFASTQGLAMPKWLVLLAGFTLCGGLAAMGIAIYVSSQHFRILRSEIRSLRAQIRRQNAPVRRSSQAPVLPVPHGSYTRHEVADRSFHKTR